MVMDKRTARCMIVGDGMVGKTCLARVFVDKTFPAQYVATVQDSYSGQSWFAGDQYSISITDSAGEHEGLEIRRMSYKKSDVILLCYSVLDRESYNSVRTHWSRETRSLARQCPVFLVALQTDLRTDKTRHVTTKEGRRMAKDIKAHEFIECSARNVNDVKDVFEHVIHTCIRTRKRKVNLLKRVLGR